MFFKKKNDFFYSVYKIGNLEKEIESLKRGKGGENYKDESHDYLRKTINGNNEKMLLLSPATSARGHTQFSTPKNSYLDHFLKMHNDKAKKLRFLTEIIENEHFSLQKTAVKSMEKVGDLEEKIMESQKKNEEIRFLFEELEDDIDEKEKKRNSLLNMKQNLLQKIETNERKIAIFKNKLDLLNEINDEAVDLSENLKQENE